MDLVRAAILWVSLAITLSLGKNSNSGASGGMQ